MKKRLTLPAAILAALASSSYADDNCFDYEKSLPDVFKCFQNRLDTQRLQLDTQQKRIAKLEKENQRMRQITKVISVSSDGKAQRICSGRTTEGSTAWVQFTYGIYVDIKTNGCGFTSTPIYISNLAGNHVVWESTGGSSPYSGTVNGFRLYVHRLTITPEKANKWGWHINWVAIGN
ncbi:MAG TPA: hypothetical protein ENG03_08705 [Thioploca sp.]|nr:hypothetical protein [Thioploca sp.]